MERNKLWGYIDLAVGIMCSIFFIITVGAEPVWYSVGLAVVAVLEFFLSARRFLLAASVELEEMKW